MRRLIMFICLIISLLTIIAYTVTLDTVFSMFGGINIDFKDVTAAISSNISFRELMGILSLLLRAFFQVYGLPLLVFLVSLNGLMQVRKRHLN